MAGQNTPKRVLELARGELGASSGDKYIRYYNELTGIGLPYGVAWCAAWVTWVMRHAGVPEDSVLNYKGCATASDWFAERGRFKSRQSGYVPKPGDIIMYEWDPQNEGTAYDDGDDHTGIVEYVQDGIVHTIEGNNGGQCKRDWWSLGNSYISGYCVPLYNIEIQKEEPDLTETEARKIAREEIGYVNPTYHKVDQVPEYWREDIRELVGKGIIRGGLAGDLELRHSDAKAAVLIKRALEQEDPIYRTIDDVPAWGRPYVQELIDRGTLEGEEAPVDGVRILNLRYSAVRLIKMLADQPISKE